MGLSASFRIVIRMACTFGSNKFSPPPAVVCVMVIFSDSRCSAMQSCPPPKIPPTWPAVSHRSRHSHCCRPMAAVSRALRHTARIEDAGGPRLDQFVGHWPGEELRAKRLELLIAGKKARLAATQKLADRAERIPGKLVRELQALPQQIAELEVDLKQMVPNIFIYRP